MFLEGIDELWFNTANRKYYDYVRLYIDRLITSDGSLRSESVPSSLPQEALIARQMLLLYRVTQERKYYRAALSIRQQFPGNRKLAAKDLYSIGPFRAEFASVTQDPEAFAEITRQFEAFRPSTHTDRAWYLSALVETLLYYPIDAPGRTVLLDLLSHNARTVVQYQDAKTDLWPREPGKPAETTFADDLESLLFIRILAKSVRLGYLQSSYTANAASAWRAILHQPRSFKDEAEPREESWENGPCRADPTSSQNDGVSEREAIFLLAASEMELAPISAQGRRKNVVIDAWFNSALRDTPAGTKERFHYKWDDLSDSGFSFFGHIFRSYGATISTLSAPPTIAALKDARIYIIVSPDTPKKNPDPNFVRTKDAEQVGQWVKAGGVLLLMANDGPNTDIDGLNLVADQFGIHFNNVLSHHVIGDTFSMGRLPASADGELFYHAHVLYMKDTCTISLKSPALSLLQNREGVFIAAAKYGKGTVLAVVDPWLYNEYTDGRKLPAEYDNFAAGNELARWLLHQVPSSRALSSAPSHSSAHSDQ